METGAQSSPAQDKQREVELFDSYGRRDGYDVFTADGTARLADAIIRLGHFPAGVRIADLGCGSGVFANLLQKSGYRVVGLDLSRKLLALGRTRHPLVEFVEGDVERLPFADAEFDGVVLGGVIHHLPDPARCAAEVYRVLRPGGTFVAFDPNRRNPMMYLYRDRSSPFYSTVGVTANERPVLAETVAVAFGNAGFKVGTEYLSGLSYRHVASKWLRWLLPLANTVDRWVFTWEWMRPFRAFVLTFGEKP